MPLPYNILFRIPLCIFESMMVFIAITGILLFFYSLLILYYHWVWDQIPSAEKEKNGVGLRGGRRGAYRMTGDRVIEQDEMMPARNQNVRSDPDKKHGNAKQNTLQRPRGR